MQTAVGRPDADAVLEAVGVPASVPRPIPVVIDNPNSMYSRPEGGDMVLVGLEDDNQIGGATAAAHNVISGNAVGIQFMDGAAANTVVGNFIGTDVTGTKPLPNNGGVINDSINNIIGGSEPGAGNVISGKIMILWNFSAPGNRAGPILAQERALMRDLPFVIDGKFHTMASREQEGGSLLSADKPMQLCFGRLIFEVGVHFPVFALLHQLKQRLSQMSLTELGGSIIRVSHAK